MANIQWAMAIFTKWPFWDRWYKTCNSWLFIQANLPIFGYNMSLNLYFNIILLHQYIFIHNACVCGFSYFYTFYYKYHSASWILTLPPKYLNIISSNIFRRFGHCSITSVHILAIFVIFKLFSYISIISGQVHAKSLYALHTTCYSVQHMGSNIFFSLSDDQTFWKCCLKLDYDIWEAELKFKMQSDIYSKKYKNKKIHKNRHYV